MEIKNDIIEDYCSFEVSKLLKEKGFKSHCIRCYNKDGKLTLDIASGKMKSVCYMPTTALAIKWIQINFKISIETRVNVKGGWASYVINDWGKCHKGSGSFLYFDEENYIHNNFKYFDTPEAATEFALLYTLNNLI